MRAQPGAKNENNAEAFIKMLRLKRAACESPDLKALPKLQAKKAHFEHLLQESAQSSQSAGVPVDDPDHAELCTFLKAISARIDAEIKASQRDSWRHGIVKKGSRFDGVGWLSHRIVEAMRDLLLLYLLKFPESPHAALIRTIVDTTPAVRAVVESLYTVEAKKLKTVALWLISHVQSESWSEWAKQICSAASSTRDFGRKEWDPFFNSAAEERLRESARAITAKEEREKALAAAEARIRSNRRKSLRESLKERFISWDDRRAAAKLRKIVCAEAVSGKC